MSATRDELSWQQRLQRTRLIASLAVVGLRLALIVTALPIASATIATSARAQTSDTTRTGGLLDRLGIDRLRLTTIGVTGGIVKPAQIEPTSLVSINADYGEVVPGWRIVFSASYWNSRYTDAVVQRFADSLRAIVVDPTGDATVEIGKVRVSVVAVGGEARWSPRRGRTRVRPYVGGALGVYALNAEGRGISGTFVESALDNIATGMAALAGGEVLLLPNFRIGMQARYDLLSGARFGSLRAGASYVFAARTGA